MVAAYNSSSADSIEQTADATQDEKIDDQLLLTFNVVLFSGVIKTRLKYYTWFRDSSFSTMEN